jgi:hypothetical protein
VTARKHALHTGTAGQRRKTHRSCLLLVTALPFDPLTGKL